MASSSKKKTTFAKITRENAVRERRLRKQAKKDAASRRRRCPNGQTDPPAGGATCHGNSRTAGSRELARRPRRALMR